MSHIVQNGKCPRHETTKGHCVITLIKCWLWPYDIYDRSMISIKLVSSEVEEVTIEALVLVFLLSL